MPTTGVFDVHLHFVPDAYRRAAVAAGFATPDGMPGIPAWTEAGMLETMDRIGIEKGVLSISSPGVHFGDDPAARALAREVNLEGARLKAAWPERLGFFASLPLPDVEGALSEIAFALDTLQAEGIYLQSNAAGVYPGDAAFEPVFAELDRRSAVVFVHPTSPFCPCCSAGERALPRPVLEFMFETTRAITNLVLNGALARYPNIKFIFPHSGGALPALVDRIALASSVLPNTGELTTDEIMSAMSGLYFDLAGVPTPRALPALRSFAAPDKILYGSDWPHTPEPLVAKLRRQLDEFLAGEEEVSQAIRLGNANKLFPNFGRPRQG